MIRKNLKYEKNIRGVLSELTQKDKDITEAGVRAYDYLADDKRCVTGEEKAELISDAVFGLPVTAGNRSRIHTHDALEILVYHNYATRNINTRKYRLVNKE